MRRLDLKARDPHEFWKKNLLVLVGEEFQDVVTSSVGGTSDYTVSGKIREANVALIALTQSYLSLLPPHANKDQANVLVLNLRNRMIFRAAERLVSALNTIRFGWNRVESQLVCSSVLCNTGFSQDRSTRRHSGTLAGEWSLVDHIRPEGQVRLQFFRVTACAIIRTDMRTDADQILTR